VLPAQAPEARAVLALALGGVALALLRQHREVDDLARRCWFAGLWKPLSKLTLRMRGKR
jgi:hypothetical protein